MKTPQKHVNAIHIRSLYRLSHAHTQFVLHIAKFSQNFHKIYLILYLNAIHLLSAWKIVEKGQDK